jgi:erythromycin esterase-like protein
MSLLASERIFEVLQEAAHPMTGAKGDYDPLIQLAGNSKYVLLGEASHGTHEFYKARADISKRFIREKGFTVIALEADWPDALRINRYIRGDGNDATALESLGDFKRFPAWMWRNIDMVDLIGWLRNYNERLPEGRAKVGVYGLDLYSLYTSIEAVLKYLEKTNSEAAAEARKRYSCFDHFGEDAQKYGLVAGGDPAASCERQAVQQLIDLQRHAAEFLSRDGRVASDERFFAEQNARVTRNAEHYYRAMYRGRPNTWNLRDAHMVETLEGLMLHLESQGENPKALVWAHNSHLGDARATQMSERGELNVGQLIREAHNNNALLVGFTTYSGTVTAASDWGGVAERKQVLPGMEGSYELLFHQARIPNFLLTLRNRVDVAKQLRHPLLERAIGVIYRPDTERWSHYFDARLSEQFDAIIHFDETRAVEPLERTAEWDRGEAETYPSGF